MILDNELIELGTIRKSYGTGGEFLLSVKNELLEHFTPRFVAVCLDGLNVPFAVESLRERGADYVISLADTQNQSLRQRMVGQRISLLRRELPADYPEQLPVDQLVGFSVYDSEKGYLGKIVEVNDQTANLLVMLDNELLLPLHDDLIEELSIDSQRLTLALPEGLV